MKSKFVFNDRAYISPSKKEARRFMRHFGDIGHSYISRLKTTWKIRHVELAPSYGQMGHLKLEQVEYGKVSTI